MVSKFVLAVGVLAVVGLVVQQIFALGANFGWKLFSFLDWCTNGAIAIKRIECVKEHLIINTKINMWLCCSSSDDICKNQKHPEKPRGCSAWTEYPVGS